MAAVRRQEEALKEEVRRKRARATGLLRDSRAALFRAEARSQFEADGKRYAQEANQAELKLADLYKQHGYYRDAMRAYEDLRRHGVSVGAQLDEVTFEYARQLLGEGRRGDAVKLLRRLHAKGYAKATQLLEAMGL